ncbi:MAG: hypothetical protein JRF34_10020 [Deltaproteobacteria bacterium]|nr:hypothetical protein [Deltaproteobacteria bacterium]
MEKLYVGSDLHSRNTYIGVINKGFKRIYRKRVVTDLSVIRNVIEPFQNEVQGIAVESFTKYCSEVPRAAVGCR